MKIPEKVINFTCYVNGSNELAGMVDLTFTKDRAYGGNSIWGWNRRRN